MGTNDGVETTKLDAPKKASISKMFSLMASFDLLLLSLGIVGAAGYGMAQPLVIVLWGDMIDGLAVSESSSMFEAIKAKCIEVLYFGVGAVVCGGLQSFACKWLAARMQQKILLEYFDIVLHKDIGWFDMHDPATIPIKIMGTANRYGDAWGDKFGAAISSLVTCVGGFILAFFKGWPIALVMVATLPFLGVGAAVMATAVQSVQREMQGWYAKAAAVVEETFYAIRTVVAFGAERVEIQRYNDAVVKARWGGVVNGFKIGLGMAYTMAVIYLSYGLAFYASMRFRYHDMNNPNTGKPWTGGEILSVFFCVLMGSFVLGTLEPGIKAFDLARVSSAEFFHARDTAPRVHRRGSDTRASITSIEKFELKDVHFGYPSKPDVKVLNGLSFTIEHGTKVAVVGESGSGKSTVMSLLERFYDAQQGQVLVNGQPISSYSISALRRCIGYVGQEPVLFATSIRENILQGVSGVGSEDLEKAIRDAQVGFVSELPEKLDTYVGAGGLQLSGGQKQRIAIARALIKQASTLFLDEATSALDNVSEQKIQETIDILTENNRNLTVIIIAHRLSTIRRADLIHVLSKGKLAESGTHDNLMAQKGLYYALVSTQDATGGGAAGDGADAPLTRQTSKSSNHSRSKSGVLATTLVAEKHGMTDMERDAKEAERQKAILKTYKAPLARLLSYNKREWPFFIPAILGALYDGASQPLAGCLLAEALYGFMKPDEEMKSHIELVCLLYVALAAGQLLATTAEHSCFAMLGESLTMRLRTAIFSKIFEQEIGFHDDPEHSPGALSAALEIYSFRVSNLCKAIGNKAASMGSLVVGLTIGFVACWQLALVLLAAVPVLVLANALQFLVLMGGSGKENEKLKSAQQVISESVQNARTVQACGSEGSLVELCARKVEAATAPVLTHAVAGFAFGVANGSMIFVLSGAFYVMGLLLKDGTGDFRDLLVAFMSVFLAALGAGQAASTMGDASKATLAAHDAFELIDRISQINGMSDMGQVPNGQIAVGNIHFQAVHFHYPFRADVKVLKGVSFNVRAGQSAGVVGPSGGGKSTIMALLQRYYDPMDGGIFIGDDRLKLTDVNVRWWRQQIGYVGQEPILFNTTVRQNVLYGMEGSVPEGRLEDCKRMANLGFLDQSSGWDTKVGPRGAHLSGGQKQRVSICRALVRDPPILLLDEATSALDSQSERLVQSALEVARNGRTSFTIAHRLSTIVDSDVILVVAEGTILERGTHTELLDQKGVYYKLYKSNGDNTAAGR